jgi:hypothetical protein
LLKVNSIKSSPLLPSSVELPPRTNIDTATANVTARMYNAKHVKEALARTLSAIRDIIDPDAAESALKKAKGGKGSDDALQKASNDGGEAQLKQFRGILKTTPVRKHSLSFSSVSGEEEFDRLVEAMDELESPSGHESADSEPSPMAMDGDGDFDSETYAAFDARIASSSDDGYDSESSVFKAKADQISSEMPEAKESSKRISREDVAGKLSTGWSSDGSSVRRPQKSTKASKRLFHSHLGIRSSRISTTASSTDEETTTETAETPLVVRDGSSAPEERVFSSESEVFKPEIVPNKVINTKSRSKPSKLEPAGTPSPKRARLEDTSDSEAHKPRRTMATKASTSTFVPSLNMVGYWSGSESEASDVEEHVAPRKNRRGQRARQQIWEKKYKDSAKHLSAEAKAKQKGRDVGWDAKRGATGKEDGWRKGRGATWKGKDFSGENGGANTVPVAVVKRGTGIAIKKNGGKDDDGPLHPSWEAKKVAKSKIAIVPFQGKKTTFD